jgi:DNA (cytosine-5)-methyltransferase 1
MRHGSLFSGIGGFDLAAEWMGWENVFHCEWNPFGQRVLKHYWPNAESFNDITKTDFTKYANKIDILTGGFPCQPYSSAGKRLGKDDERHLWPEMLRAIREISPRFVVGENVRGLTNWNGGMVFEEVCAELESYGYQVAPVIIPACGVGAPHRRERIWFVAQNTMRSGLLQRESIEKGAEVWQQRNTSTGSSDRVYISEGITANAESSTKGSPRESGGVESNGGQNNDESFKWRKPTQFDIGRYKLLRDATNADGNGLNQRNSNDEKQPSKGGEYALGNIGKSNVNGDATDTKYLRCEQCQQQGQSRCEKGIFEGVCIYGITTDTTSPRGGKDNGNRKPRFNDQKSTPNNWDNFPTQSPICGGDDGLPTELDAIAFSKWRAESIKAYGNAIVPQVAYQIFKAIRLTNENTGH